MREEEGVSASPVVAAVAPGRPIVVDLDDTLVKTDLLLEAVLLLAKKQPLALFKIPFWLARGKAFFKSRLAERVSPDASCLPYRHDVLALARKLRGDHSAKLVLASASPEPWVRAVADHLGCFDDILGTRDLNLRGRDKLALLRSRYGADPNAYFGDCSADLPLWEASEIALAVNPSRAIQEILGRSGKEVILIQDRGSRSRTLLRAIRIHQWSKNVLVFVPLVAGHFLLEYHHWLRSLAMFLAFSFIASAVYVMNDLLDLESDRHHVSKRLRPFASGSLSLRTGLLLIPLLLAASATTATLLPWSAIGVLCGYVLLNVLYSWKFKRLLMLDVVTLATLYTSRIFAGGLAADIPLSHWLLTFSIFFFFGLALIKRFTEIHLARGKGAIRERGYESGDRESVLALGSTSSLVSVVILCFYIDSPKVMELYRHPQFLWLIVPPLLYWIGRVWTLAHRGQIHEDPVVFALKDRATWLVGLAFVCILGLSI